MLNIPSDKLNATMAYDFLKVISIGKKQLKKTRFRFTAKVDKLLNVAYRDYLNCQGYFADDLGINATFGIRLKF